MSIVEKTSHKPDIAHQRAKPFISLRVAILLGMAVGVSLLAAVILSIEKNPGEIPAVTPVAPLDMGAGSARPISQTQYGRIVSPVNTATSNNTSAEQAPASSAVVKSKADAQQGAEADVRMAVAQWAAAWSRQDTESYLACYAGDFNVPGGMSRAAWEAQRKLRIAGPHSIKVELRQVEVSLSADGIASVRFVQDFRADNYREAGTKKELRLKNENGRWRIFSEKVV